LVDDVYTARENTDLPIPIGSGITEMNIAKYWDLADALIVGS
jgi:predicted TIM-barrel enzyme